MGIIEEEVSKPWWKSVGGNVYIIESKVRDPFNT